MKLLKEIVNSPRFSYDEDPHEKRSKDAENSAKAKYEQAIKNSKPADAADEDIIAKSIEYSYLYAINVLKGRFKKGEDYHGWNLKFYNNKYFDLLNDHEQSYLDDWSEEQRLNGED